MAINAKRDPIRLRGSLWHKGFNIQLRPSGIVVNGAAYRSSISGGGLVNLGLDMDTTGSVLKILVLQGEMGWLVSEPDPIRLLTNSVNAFHGRTGDAKPGIFKPQDED